VCSSETGTRRDNFGCEKQQSSRIKRIVWSWSWSDPETRISIGQDVSGRVFFTGAVGGSMGVGTKRVRRVRSRVIVADDFPRSCPSCANSSDRCRETSLPKWSETAEYSRRPRASSGSMGTGTTQVRGTILEAPTGKVSTGTEAAFRQDLAKRHMSTTSDSGAAYAAQPRTGTRGSRWA
jgi:hypothetical protein